jgi:hypothetical protein
MTKYKKLASSRPTPIDFQRCISGVAICATPRTGGFAALNHRLISPTPCMFNSACRMSGAIAMTADGRLYGISGMRHV